MNSVTTPVSVMDFDESYEAAVPWCANSGTDTSATARIVTTADIVLLRAVFFIIKPPSSIFSNHECRKLCGVHLSAAKNALSSDYLNPIAIVIMCLSIYQLYPKSYTRTV